MKVFEGTMDGSGLSIGIAVARFNQLITGALLSGATEALRRCGVEDDKVHVAWVPGAIELPLICQTMARSKRYDAVIAIGCVIRGETPHFDYVAGESAKGVARVALDTGIPVIFGVLTTENTAQALERSGIKSGNKGADCALAAIEMARLIRALPQGK